MSRKLSNPKTTMGYFSFKEHPMERIAEPHMSRDKYLPDTSLAVYLRLYDYENRYTEISHSHDFHELVYVISGTGEHVVGEKKYSIFPGDVFLIKPGIVHTYQSINNLRLANYLFIPERITDLLLPLRSIVGYYVLFEVDANLDPALRFKGRRSLNAEQNLVIEKLTRAIAKEQDSKNEGWQWMVTLTFTQMLVILCRIFSSSGTKQCQENIRISKVVQYIEANYMHHISLEELAEVFGRSMSQFLKTFRAVTGYPPIRYLIKFRLNKAANLLITSEQSIMEIAFKVGFSDSNYFTKMFSREFSKSPRAYRTLHRGIQ